MVIFEPNKDEIIGGWRKYLNEGLHKLYYAPNMLRMIESRRMRLARHVARMGRRGMHTGFWRKNQEERDH
jgi:hypothetical protein